MSQKYSIVEKFKITSALVVIFLMVLAINIMSNHQLKISKNTISSIYEERLVASDLIYRISKKVDDEMTAIYCNEIFNTKVNSPISASLDDLLDQYANTELTEKEDRIFRDLRENIHELMEIDTDKGDITESWHNKYLKNFEKVNEDLLQLSYIQLKEGKTLMSTSNKETDKNRWIIYMEIMLLIFVGLLIVIVLFRK